MGTEVNKICEYLRLTNSQTERQTWDYIFPQKSLKGDVFLDFSLESTGFSCFNKT